MKRALILGLVLGLTAVTYAGEWFDPAKNNAMQPEGKDDFNFVVLGDSRPDGDQKPDVTHQPKGFHDNIAQINKQEHDFSVNVGDLVLGYCEKDLLLKEWDMYDKTCEEYSQPYVNVIGNHDYWNEVSRDVWGERYGAEYFSFDHKGAHFIVLNSEVLGKQYEIEGAQLAWLKGDLEKAGKPRATFVFLHGPQWHYKATEWDRDVHSLFVEHGVDIVFAGHEHRYCLDPERDGVKYVITGGGGAGLDTRPGGFYHFCLVSVKGDSAEYKVITPEGKELPAEVMTDKVFRSVEQGIKLKRVEELGKKGEVTLELSFNNAWPNAVTVEMSLDAAGGSWLEKSVKEEIAAGETGVVKLATNTGGKVLPPPVVTVKAVFGEVGAYRKEFRPAMSAELLGLSEMLVDDFEDGDKDNLCGSSGITGSNGNWHTDCDKLGVTEIAWKIEKTAGEGGKETAALHVTGKRGKSTPPSDWVWVVMQTMLSAEVGANDIRPSVGISFKAKSAAKNPLAIEVPATVKGINLAGTGATHRHAVETGCEWKEYKLYWHEFRQPEWICPGEQCAGPLTVDKVELLVWAPTEDGKSFDFWLDDIELIYEGKK